MNTDFDFDIMIEHIKSRKKELKMTNQQLSEISGVSYGTLNKILVSETKEPSIGNIIKISAALGLSTEFVITGHEKSTSSVNERDAYKEMLSELSDDELKELKKFTAYLLWKRDHEER